jgi:hypothetical protein
VVLDWFGRAKRASVSELIARKHYKKAVEAIKAELQKRRKDRGLRLRLAEVLVLADRKKEAIEILGGLADDLVLAGFAAQAIAVLKKIHGLDPERVDVEEKLVYLVNQQQRPAEDPWLIAQRRRELEAPLAHAPELGMEELSSEGGAELGMEAADEPTSEASPEPPSFTDDAVRDELVSLIEEALTPSAEEGSVPQASAPQPGAQAGDRPPAFQSPLFEDLEPQELALLIQGLRLVAVEPGEIIITEGEPRGSLFIITSGTVRAYVRHSSGRSLPIRDLHEGDFFGEIAILSGQPRTATVTAATHCELLELDRPSLDSICRSHPRVREVLQQFHDARANNTIEAAIRQMQLGGSA